MTQRCPRSGIPSQFCSCNLHARIGGQLDAAAYAALAAKHRPTDEASLAREAQALAARGLTERDIGQALQLDTTQVRALLQRLPAQPGAARGDEAAAIHTDAWSAQRGAR